MFYNIGPVNPIYIKNVIFLLDVNLHIRQRQSYFAAIYCFELQEAA
jgi:hypothetical protein